MACVFETKPVRGSVYNFYPEDIHVRPEDNGRIVPGNVEMILASFRLVGQLQPIGIDNVDGVPYIEYGFCRWQAAILFNKEQPPEKKMRLACVYKQSDDALDTAIMNIHENHIRNETQELDDAHNIVRLRTRFNKSDEEIAAIYQRSVAWVRKRAKLINLTAEAKQAYIDKALKKTAADRIAHLSAEAQKQVIKNGGKTAAGPVKPTRNEIFTQLDLIASSTAHDKKVCQFAANFIKYLKGELEGSVL